MSGGRGRRVGSGLAGLLLLALGCLEARDEAQGPRPPAPGFVLPALDGGEVALESLRGRVVILDFWATWCAPCEVQMPVLDALWRQGDPGLEVIGISVDTRPGSEVADWVGERGFEYPIVLGDQRLAMEYGVRGFPSLVVVDEQGRIATRHLGVWSRPELEEAVVLARRLPEAGPSSGPPTTGRDATLPDR